MRFNLNNKFLALFLIAAALLLFSGQLFTIFGITDIRLVTTTATCTGNVQGTALSDADCKSFGPTAYGSSGGGWAFSTSGEGIITVPTASKQVAVTGVFRQVGGSADLQIYNYAAGVYEPSGFVFKGSDDPEAEQTRSYGSNYLDSAKTSIKFKWTMSCSGNCATGAEKLRITQYDTVTDITTTSTSTTSTSTITNASSQSGVLTTSTALTTTSTLTTVSATSGSYSTSTVIGQQTASNGFSLGGDGITMLIVTIAAIAVFIYFRGKR